MAYDARAVANYFLDKAAAESLRLDPMKLQKLAYIAHGWHLAITDQPLIFDRIEAWPYGPVIPSLYQAFKEYGARVVTNKTTSIDPFTGQRFEWSLNQFAESDKALSEDQEILDRVWDAYKGYSSLQLSTLTHQPGTPWDKAADRVRPAVVRDLPIDDELIRQHYVALANQNRAHATR